MPPFFFSGGFLGIYGDNRINVMHSDMFMKAGDIVATTGNWFIQMTTVSKWSHVAIAIDRKHVIEAIPGEGVVVRPLITCVEKAKSSVIFERPKELDVSEQLKLLAMKNECTAVAAKYSFLRAGYSGLPHFLRIILIMAAVTNQIVAHYFFIFLPKLNNLYEWFFDMSTICAWCMPFVKLIGMTKQINEFLAKWNAPEFLKNNLKNQYCSALVVDVDSGLSGGIADLFSATSEIRPKDVVLACEKRDWNQIKIK